MTNAAGGSNCTISQFLENAAQFNELQMTCSVLKITTDGSQSFITATKTASGWTDSTDILAFFGTSSAWRWINPGETLIGAKLEVGSRQTFVYKQADGTYTLNNIPPVAEQLAICNKYNPETGKLLVGWEHPPMQEGIEYRTMEQYLGKPVYAKLVNCGNFPAPGSSKQIAHGISDCYPIRVTGQMSNSNTVPWNEAYNIGADNTSIRLFARSGFSDQSGTNTVALIHYTKTTD